jgi:DNA-binding GntR family transcriptional regulator
VKRIKTVKNLRNEVYNVLRAGIADGSLPPGTQLKESDLVRELGVSRTPIREALNQLSKEGLIDFITGRGAFVKRWTKEETFEILFIREALEGLAARLAAERFTEDDLDRLTEYMDDYRAGRIDYAQADKLFHEHIINASGMERLIGMIRNLYDGLQMTNMLRIIFMLPGRVDESLAEHVGLIEAFRAGDADQAERLAREHLRQTRSYYGRILGEEANRNGGDQ